MSEQRKGRISEAMERARIESERAREYAEDARKRSPVVDFAWNLADRDRQRLGGLLAGAVAFRCFLWLLPFTLLFVGVLGAATAVAGNDAPDDLSDELGLQGVLTDLVREGGQQSGWWIALVIGLFGTAYAGVGVVRALRISHAAAWGIRPERGANPLMGSLWAFVVVTGLLVVSTFVTWLRESSGPLGTILTVLGMAAVYFLVWWRVSSVLPRREGPLRTLVPGAVLVAVGLQCLSLFTVYYLADRAERATSLYGAIGVALTLLLWLYIISRLIVGAAILNAELAQRPARR